MRYKPERALTQVCHKSIHNSWWYVEMRYKPERALTRKAFNVGRGATPVHVEMRYKPERALTHAP